MGIRASLRGRLALIAVITLSALLVGGVLFWQPDAANAAGTHKYSFEDCEEGWKVEENHTDPTTATTWQRSEPGAPNDPAGFAMRSRPYPIGFEAPDTIYVASAVSPAHPHTGGEITVSYYVQYDLEADLDFLYFEWSRDGKAWTEVEKWTGLSPTFTLVESKFTAPVGPVFVRFRLTSDELFAGNTGAGQVAFDEVIVPFDPPKGSACGAAPSGTATATAGPSGSASPTISSSPTPGPTDAPEKCTMSGTRKADTLRGSNRADVICGRGGADKILGRGGKDTLRGQQGQDRLNGGGGFDACFGGRGTDGFTSCEEERQ